MKRHIIIKYNIVKYANQSKSDTYQTYTNKFDDLLSMKHEIFKCVPGSELWPYLKPRTVYDRKISSLNIIKVIITV